MFSSQLQQWKSFPTALSCCDVAEMLEVVHSMTNQLEMVLIFQLTITFYLSLPTSSLNHTRGWMKHLVFSIQTQINIHMACTKQTKNTPPPPPPWKNNYGQSEATILYYKYNSWLERNLHERVCRQINWLLESLCIIAFSIIVYKV